jgi:hypothetical protein
MLRSVEVEDRLTELVGDAGALVSYGDTDGVGVLFGAESD